MYFFYGYVILFSNHATERENEKTKSEATAGERRFALYNYLIKNTWEGHTETPTEIFDYLLTHYGIEKPNIKTFYSDLAALERETPDMSAARMNCLFITLSRFANIMG